MHVKLKIAIVAAVAALAAVAMTTTAIAGQEGKSQASAKKAEAGGTYRVEWEVVVRLHRRLRSDG